MSKVKAETDGHLNIAAHNFKVPFISCCVRVFWEYLPELFHKDWTGRGWLCPCTAHKTKIGKEHSGWVLFIISSMNVSKFDLKWARRKLETAALLSPLASEIASGQINGRLATQTGKPSNAFFLLPEPFLSEQIIMNHYLWREAICSTCVVWSWNIIALQDCPLGLTPPSTTRPVKHGKTRTQEKWLPPWQHIWPVRTYVYLRQKNNSQTLRVRTVAFQRKQNHKINPCREHCFVHW